MNRSLKSFFIVLVILFGIPWLALVVGPWFSFYKLDRVAYEASDSAPDTYYPPLRPGVVLGAQVYGSNGCSYCHTQMIRPTYVGVDVWRPGWAGREDPKLARETLPRDYLGEKYAYLGQARIGPDLSNVGNRIKEASWHYGHLYNPRAEKPGSVMPAFRNLFEKREVIGIGSQEAVATEEKDGVRYELVPSNEAKALVLYLLTMKKDHKLPGKLVSTK
jgi:cytochrome c oxidase cbb3-type subunit II